MTGFAPARGSSPRPLNKSAWERLAPFAVAAITALAAVLCFHALEARSLWSDEGYSVALARLDWPTFLKVIWVREGNMVLYYLLLRAWMLVGESEFFLRTLSVLPALATVPLVFALGRRMFGPVAGVLAALLLAVNAAHIRLAQEARSYTLLVLLVTLSCYFFLNCVERASRKDWTAYAVASALAFYAHYFAVLALAAQGGAWLLLGRRAPQRKFARALAIYALLTLPGWAYLLCFNKEPFSWIPKLSLAQVASFVQMICGGNGPLLATLGLGLCAVALAAGAQANRRDPEKLWRYAFLALWLALPVLLLLAYSVKRPMFVPRYLVLCLPPVMLLCAAGLLALRPRWTMLPVTALLLWLMAGGVRTFYGPEGIGRWEDYRGASNYVLDGAQRGDAIIFLYSHLRLPYEFYAERHRRAAERPFVAYPGPTVSELDFIGRPFPWRWGPQHRRIWLVVHPSVGERDPDLYEYVDHTIRWDYPVAAPRKFRQLTVVLYTREASGDRGTGIVGSGDLGIR